MTSSVVEGGDDNLQAWEFRTPHAAPLPRLALRNVRRSVFLSVICFGLFLLIGCASRNPVVNRQPPAQPAATPQHTEASAKNSTALPPDPGAKPGAHPKHKVVPPPLPAGYSEEGNASWYGVPFNGRRAANGEIYDMYKMTAAHRTFPFETMVRVTNMNNGKTAVVRITDRGPFVDNRIIDLSLTAAQLIESVGPGVVPVRLEVISGAADPTGGFFTVQVGAFRERAHAERLKERLSATYSPIFIQPYDSSDGTLYRVRVGKIPGEDAARQYAGQLHTKEDFTTFVVRLDETGAPGSVSPNSNPQQ
jgi:rare lipoprotein A